MQIALLVVVLLALAVLAYLLGRLRSLGVRERALRAELAALDPTAVLPPALERAFTSGSGRVLTVEILNALELAQARHKLAGVAGAVAPDVVRGIVYEQAARITREQLATHGVAADVRVHSAAPAE